ncbi:hypothetical protein FRC08_002241 [Ceratobasidium sp. 394]|nr:hypothetical protein FRC08_002241 [Ceratobasidium sp. 394]
MSQVEHQPTPPVIEAPVSPTLTQDSEPAEQKFQGSGTAEDPFVVDWVGDDDKENPYNWNTSYRYVLAVLIGLSAFCVTYASSAYTGGLDGIIRDLNTTLDISLLGLALYVLGFGLGPLVWGPLSEVYGRRPIFFASYIPYTFFHLGSALSPSVASLMVFRLLAGAFGASVFSVPAGIVGELFRPHERGPVGLLVLAVGPLIGPVFGPIGGGFISQSGHKGWRWNFWAMFIFAVLTLVVMIFVPETFAPVLLRRRAEKLQKDSGGQLHYISKFDVHGRKKPSTTLKIALSRPFSILIHEPIVLILTIYVALIYGVLYGLFASFPIVFGSHRGWSPGKSGLAFLGVGLGICISIVLSPTFNRRYIRLAQKGAVAPEERLVMCCVGAVLLPISLIWFAWTSYPSVHWIVPIIAGIPFGTGIIFAFTSVVAYLVDIYTLYAASCLAANSVVRSVVAFAFPLFVPRLFERVGDQWACMVFGFLALFCLPMPFLIYKYGPAIRSKSKLIDQLAHTPKPSAPPAAREKGEV